MTITIKDERMPLSKWLRMLGASVVLVFGPIAIGIAAGSSAMQWAGFIFGLLTLLAFAKKMTEGDAKVARSIAEARRFLDDLEKAGRS